jgi:Putative beta-lactamase-inhibitor-like, PepSY-like
MKKISMTIALGSLLAFVAQAQKINASKVPAVVKASFAKVYPGILAKWEKEDGNYEVNFSKSGHAMSAVIEPNGSIIETETAIRISDLPAKVAAYVKEHYAGKPIKEASKIINADRSESYEARVNGKDLIFDTDGKFIKEAKD